MEYQGESKDLNVEGKGDVEGEGALKGMGILKGRRMLRGGVKYSL